MANSITHAGLPFPVYGALYSMGVPFLDADGDPTDQTTPDTEISLDGGAFGDTTNEVAVVTVGFGWITFTAAEMTCDLAMVAFKCTSGPKTTCAVLQPRRLPTCAAGTATAGAAGTITLAAGSSAVDDFYNGKIIRVNSGTGPGQARMITDYVGATKVASVAPNWETNPGNDSVYEILSTELAPNKLVDETRLALAAGVAVTSIGNDVITAASINTGAISADAFAANAIVSATLADDCIAAAKIATGAFTADAFAADAIVAATLATGVLTADAFAANAIVSATLADDCIAAAKIATGALTADAFAADAIVAATLATGVLTADAFAADAIVAATLATGALTADAFAADSIAAAAIKADTVTKIQAGLSASIGTGGITSASFATGAITADAIAADAIAASELAATAASEIGEQASDLRLKWQSTQLT